MTLTQDFQEIMNEEIMPETRQFCITFVNPWISEYSSDFELVLCLS